MVEETHWDGLADGHTRATTVDPAPVPATRTAAGLEPLSALLIRRHADVTVATRPLTDYTQLTTSTANTRENR